MRHRLVGQATKAIFRRTKSSSRTNRLLERTLSIENSLLTAEQVAASQVLSEKNNWRILSQLDASRNSKGVVSKATLRDISGCYCVRQFFFSKRLAENFDVASPREFGVARCYNDGYVRPLDFDRIR